jgi:hypothetical protein
MPTPDPVLVGRDLDVSIPMAAASNGVAVIEGLAAVFVELVNYARAGDLVLDWRTLKVGIEAPDEGLLPPLTIRLRMHARRPLIPTDGPTL